MSDLLEQVEIPPTDQFTISTCGCGCNQPVHPPYRYCKGHARRKSPLEYIPEDRGYISPCWIWQRSTNRNGYGMSWDCNQKRTRPAHCILYERHRQPIPEGMTVDHLCKVKCCINPDHLEVVTRRENSQRGMNSRLDIYKVSRMRYLKTIGVHYAELSKIFGVSWQTARMICLGKKWKI